MDSTDASTSVRAAVTASDLLKGALAGSFERVFRAAISAWPTVDLPRDVYATHLARQLASGSAETALEALQTDDLYLACACARGNPQALAAFERRCMCAADDALVRQRICDDMRNEIKQRLRERVLVSGARPAGIDSFSGRGSLRSWLFVMATREAMAMKRQAGREVPIDEQVALHTFVTSDDGELAQLKVRHRDVFRKAFDDALRTLPSRDQTLLRQHALDGLTIDKLGVLYHVHRSTAARNLERARKAVLAETRSRMREQLGVASGELDSILRMIRSRLDVSLQALLRRRAPTPRSRR